jgi:Trm5-related predicted tRNA methylase
MSLDLNLISALAVSGTVASVIASIFEVYVLKKYRKPENLESRIIKLSAALKESSRLVGEVEDEISKRQALVTALQQDADRYQKLVSINREQVEAVAQLLQGELRKEGRKSFWGGVAVNFVFFSLGALLSWYLAK